MATSGRGSGVVGYNVQVAVDTEHHLIIMHEVTNSGSDRAHLSNIASHAKHVLGVDKLEAVADRGYFSGDQILACDRAGIEVTLPKPMTSGIEAKGRFGKQDFVYLSDEDVYRCRSGEKLKYYYTNEENGQKLRRYWTNACRHCALKHRCTTGVQRRIARWEHEHVLAAVQKRLDANPQAMRQRRETVEHPFGTMKARMGATHFLIKRLPKVATEMALHVRGLRISEPFTTRPSRTTVASKIKIGKICSKRASCAHPRHQTCSDRGWNRARDQRLRPEREGHTRRFSLRCHRK
jgi:macrodomain Ter protein organizer (MatP/YcbG family)